MEKMRAAVFHGVNDIRVEEVERVGLAFIGVVLGLFATVGLIRFASSILYGASATGPATFIYTSLLILAAAALA